MKNNYILLVTPPGSKTVCYRGEGGVFEIQRDIQDLTKNGYRASTMSVHPVIGRRKHLEVSFGCGIIFGAGIIVLGKWLYKKIRSTGVK